MKDASFYFRWRSFLLCFLLGIVGMLILLVTAQTERRDKTYSGLLGCGLGTLVNIFLWKYIPGIVPVV